MQTGLRMEGHTCWLNPNPNPSRLWATPPSSGGGGFSAPGPQFRCGLASPGLELPWQGPDQIPLTYGHPNQRKSLPGS